VYVYIYKTGTRKTTSPNHPKSVGNASLGKTRRKRHLNTFRTQKQAMLNEAHNGRNNKSKCVSELFGNVINKGRPDIFEYR